MKPSNSLRWLKPAASFVFVFLIAIILIPRYLESAPASEYAKVKKKSAASSEPASNDAFLDDIIDGTSTPPPEASEPPPSEVAPEPAATSDPSPTIETTPSEPVAEAAPESEPAAMPVDKDLLANIVFSEKNIKAYGWGEYKVGGRCLCCDNFMDGDCIVVHTTNRSERTRIKQIVDGNIEADTADKTTYFGDVVQRESPELVNTLMAEITLKKMRDIYRVIVYTVVDKERKKNYLPSCELGYYDRFDRLQWAGRKESKWSDECITFELEKPILTQSILLKVKGGNSKITDVALFGLDEKK